MTYEEEQILLAQVAHLTRRLDAFERGNKFLILDKDIELSKSIGTRIGTDAKQKVGFYGQTPVIQNTSPNGKQDKSGSGGANVTDGTGYNGNTGTLYYTIGDIVYALKQLGLIDT